MHRRDFLKFGGAAVTALSTTTTFGQDGPTSSDFGFIVEPDFIARRDETTGQISHVSPVIVPQQFGDFLPSLLTDYMPSPDEAETWFKSRFSSCCTGGATSFDTSNPLDARASVTFLADPFLLDIPAHIARHQAFMPSNGRVGPGQERPQDRIALNIYSSTNARDPIAVTQDQQGYRLHSQTSGLRPDALQPMAAYGTNIYTSPWLRVFMAYPETHPLIPCEYRNVLHLKFDMFLWPNCTWSWWSGCQYTSGGSQITSLHVGSVSGQRCLVVFDSMHQWICVNTCNTMGLSYATVQNGIQRALASSPIPSWLVPTIAGILTGIVLSTGIVALA